MNRLKAVSVALALVGCTGATPADRQAFDLILAKANNGPLGIAVKPGDEDKVFECYRSSIQAKRVPLAELTGTIQQAYGSSTDDLMAMPDGQKREFSLRILLVSSTIVECQGGLPEGMR